MAPSKETPVEMTPLDLAIDTVSDKTLRAVFKSICSRHTGAREDAMKRLLVDDTEGKKEPSTDEEPGTKREDQGQDQDGSAKSAAKKRPVPRFAYCQNCEKEFDVTQNSATSCVFHPCPDEPTGEELWEDNWDEFDVEGFRDDFPEAYTFPCCGGNLRDNPKGCTVDWHRDQEGTKPAKRARAQSTIGSALSVLPAC